MYISIDVGGTNTRVVGSADLEQPAFLSQPIRYPNTHDYETDLRRLISSAKQVANGNPVQAVGISTPGLPNPPRTQLAYAHNLADWAGRPLTVPLSEELSCPVYYNGDVIAAGFGEIYYGKVDGDFHFIIWGTGIGGADFKRSTSKQEYEASNIAWDRYLKDWETDCGGANLAKNFGKATKTFSSDDWDKVSQVFNQHLSSYIERRHPQSIVFAGGLAVKNGAWLLSLGNQLPIKLQLSKFGEDSGLMGGFGLIKHELK